MTVTDRRELEQQIRSIKDKLQMTSYLGNQQSTKERELNKELRRLRRLRNAD
jgi:hypothetical protein